MNKFLLTFLVFSILPGQRLLAQQTQRKILKGKINAFANNLQGIYVINIATEKAAITEDNGYFTIAVAAGDSLMLSSINFKGRKIAINDEDLQQNLLLIKLQPLMQQLDEVQVFQYKNINAVALGIIPKGQKSYTPAERKYKTASDWDPQIGLNTSVSLDPLLNSFSGRSAMLKKGIEVEKKEMMMDKIDYLFEEKYFVEKLKIPQEYIRGFYFYIVENKRFADAVNVKNKSLATFIMGELAVKYIEMNGLEISKD